MPCRSVELVCAEKQILHVVRQKSKHKQVETQKRLYITERIYICTDWIESPNTIFKGIVETRQVAHLIHFSRQR